MTQMHSLSLVNSGAFHRFHRGGKYLTSSWAAANPEETETEKHGEIGWQADHKKNFNSHTCDRLHNQAYNSQSS